MKTYTFNDVLFIPQYSTVRSRKDVDTTSDMQGFSLPLPIISANMRDITGAKMAATVAIHGGLGLLHRFCTIEENIEMYNEAISLVDTQEQKERIGVSIGVHEADKDRLDKLIAAGAKIVCIDIAHGHCIMMKEMLTHIRRRYPRKRKEKSLYVIAGNIATPEAAKDLIDWGADAIKCGVGPGSVCQTRKSVAAGFPQLGALDNIRTACPDAVIIADGGVKNTGDIAKDIKFANAVMLGSFLAGTSETPGHVYENKDGQFYKTYGGSASAENKVKSGNENAFVEGVMTTVPFRGHVRHILMKIHQNLQSSFSYSGANNLKEFQKKSEFVFLTGAGKEESKL